jgi:hypothetical protein
MISVGTKNVFGTTLLLSMPEEERPWLSQLFSESEGLCHSQRCKLHMISDHNHLQNDDNYHNKPVSANEDII